MDIDQQTSLEDLITRALLETGHVSSPPADWEVRTRGGELLQSLEGITSGTTLFLNMWAGVGGNT